MTREKRKLQLVSEDTTKLYKAMDEGIARTKPLETSCKRGCNACCRMNTIVTVGEAFAIVAKHASFVASRLDKLLAQSMQVTQLSITHTDDDTMAKAWWDLQIRCALLLDNGDCGVYESRPVACRTHYVVDDPKQCAAVPTVRIKHWVPGNRDNAYAGLVAIWFGRVGESGTYHVGSLPKMVLAAYNTCTALEEEQER